MAISTGEQATAADVVAAIDEKTVIGEYTGNNGAARQITLGFKPRLVIITQHAGGLAQWILTGLGTNSCTMSHQRVATTNHFDDSGSSYIHGTDGFVVDVGGAGTYKSNTNATLYQYIAIG